MHAFIKAFLLIPVEARVTILMGILVFVWCVFGKLILKIVSVLPWLLNKLFLGGYMIIEIPISILHSKYGSVFGKIDQGLTTGTEKACCFMNKLFKKMKNSKNIYTGRVIVLYLVIVAYVLIPYFANLTEKPFTFWQDWYIEKELVVYKWMDDKGWLKKN